MNARHEPEKLTSEPESSRPTPLLVNAREAARLLGIGTRLLWALTNRREVPSVRIGRLVKYRPSDLQAYVEGLRR
jgi:excisionase family DNA binding protein